MSAKKGQDILLTIDGTQVAGLIDNPINIEDALIVVTSKDSVDSNGKLWEERDTGVGTWSMEITSIYDPTGAMSWDDIAALIINNSGKVALTWGSTVSGEYKYEGDAIVESASMSAPHDDRSEGSATFQGSGPITQTTVS